VALWLFVVAVAMQVVRAKIEERKFLRTLEALVRGVSSAALRAGGHRLPLAQVVRLGRVKRVKA
jgi:hypothetical protein